MELKSLKADSVTIEDAYKQIKNYMKSIESFFIYNAFCVISDQSHTRAGTITANYDRFMEWKNKIKIVMTGGTRIQMSGKRNIPEIKRIERGLPGNLRIMTANLKLLS